MIEINGKEYKINMDLKLGTQKLIGKIMENPTNPKNQIYMEHVIRDILIPSPSKEELFHFRMSDIERVFEEFTREAKETDSDFKKKRSH